MVRVMDFMVGVVNVIRGTGTDPSFIGSLK